MDGTEGEGATGRRRECKCRVDFGATMYAMPMLELSILGRFLAEYTSRFERVSLIVLVGIRSGGRNQKWWIIERIGGARNRQTLSRHFPRAVRKMSRRKRKKKGGGRGNDRMH